MKKIGIKLVLTTIVVLISTSTFNVNVYASADLITNAKYSWNKSLWYLQSSNEDFQFYYIENNKNKALQSNILPEMMLASVTTRARGYATLLSDLKNAGYQIQDGIHSGIQFVFEQSAINNSVSAYYKYKTRIYDRYWNLVNESYCAASIMSDSDNKDALSFEVPAIDNLQKGIYYVEFFEPTLINQGEYLDILK